MSDRKLFLVSVEGEIMVSAKDWKQAMQIAQDQAKEETWNFDYDALEMLRLKDIPPEFLQSYPYTSAQDKGSELTCEEILCLEK
jgi:hypothetical protein